MTDGQWVGQLKKSCDANYFDISKTIDLKLGALNYTPINVDLHDVFELHTHARSVVLRHVIAKSFVFCRTIDFILDVQKA